MLQAQKLFGLRPLEMHRIQWSSRTSDGKGELKVAEPIGL
jgi:hypothetical protein